MWNRPTEKDLSQIPAFYETEGIDCPDKIIHLHFFIGGCDWYVAEYDPANQMFWGFAILNEDYQNAEWGYFSFQELCEIKVSFLEIDRDLHFRPIKAREIEKIKKARGYQ